jgi:hypothetical protein
MEVIMVRPIIWLDKVELIESGVTKNLADDSGCETDGTEG